MLLKPTLQFSPPSFPCYCLWQGAALEPAPENLMAVHREWGDHGLWRNLLLLYLSEKRLVTYLTSLGCQVRPRKANKMLLLGYMYLLFSVILFLAGETGGKHAAPNSQRNKTSSLIPVPDRQNKTAELRLPCKDVAGKWRAPKWKLTLIKGANITLIWSMSLPPGSTWYF